LKSYVRVFRGVSKTHLPGYVLNEYVDHYHRERNHQGKGNVLLFPLVGQGREREGPTQSRERLGGLLKYYHRDAA
jgi:hypothetical protein